MVARDRSGKQVTRKRSDLGIPPGTSGVPAVPLGDTAQATTTYGMECRASAAQGIHVVSFCIPTKSRHTGALALAVQCFSGAVLYIGIVACTELHGFRQPWPKRHSCQWLPCRGAVLLTSRSAAALQLHAEKQAPCNADCAWLRCGRVTGAPYCVANAQVCTQSVRPEGALPWRTGTAATSWRERHWRPVSANMAFGTSRSLHSPEIHLACGWALYVPDTCQHMP